MENDTRSRIAQLAMAAIALLAIAFAIPHAALAVDIHPDVKQALKEDGRWERTKEIILKARAAGMDAHRLPGKNTLAAGVNQTSDGFATRIPCLLLEFSDNLWADGDVSTSVGYIDSMLFSVGEFPTGSMREYYREASYGAVDITGDVYGPIMMPEPYSYYVGDAIGLGDEPNSQTMAKDACNAADALVDFSQYDLNGDNEVDGVMLIVAGYGFEESADSTAMQSHQWQIPGDQPLFLDGARIFNYTVQPEEHGSFAGGGVNGIGTLCHEWGHIFGLPDLYDLDGSSYGVGSWSIMGSGNYLDNSNTPAHFDPWCKSVLGWVTVDAVQTNRVNQEISAFATSPDVFRLWIPGLPSSEYFLVANRYATGFDSELPGSGLLIMRIDESKLYSTVNNQEYIPGIGDPSQHYLAAVVQADGDYDLESYTNTGDNQDLYTDQTIEFDDLTEPSSRGYSGIITEVAVWNISAPGATMTANLDVRFSRPRIEYISHVFDDLAGGDNDGTPDPGETVDMLITSRNVWKTTSDVEVTVTCEHPAVQFSTAQYTIPLMESGDPYLNFEDPVVFSVAAGIQPEITEFIITYSAEGGEFTFAETLSVDLGPKQVLVVDDDNRHLNSNYAHYYTDALEGLRVPYAVHDKFSQGSPSAATLAGYPMVLWFTGKPRTETILHSADIDALTGYLDGGGSLFMTGQDIAQTLSASADSTFMKEYLGVRYFDSREGIGVHGLAGDPVADEMSLLLGGPGTAANQQSSDILLPETGTLPSMYYNASFEPGQPTDQIGAVTLARDGFKVVFWGFGFEAVNSELTQYGIFTREQALSRVLEWLVNLSTGILDTEEEFEFTDTNAVPGTFHLRQNYPNPFNAETIIEFSVTSAAEEVTLVVYDVLGRRVTTIYVGVAESGMHRYTWDGTDNRGNPVSSGVYFAVIHNDQGVRQSKTMVLMK